MTLTFQKGEESPRGTEPRDPGQRPPAVSHGALTVSKLLTGIHRLNPGGSTVQQGN